MQNMHWNDDISRPLKNLYEELQQNRAFNNDEKYLQEAFKKAEKQWGEQFEKMKEEIKFVMISEAPSETYFYDPATPKFTSFLWYSDIAEVFKPSENQKLKKDAYNILEKNHFIILDIFPYALNKKTAISYRGLRDEQYHKLIEDSYSSYLEKKLQLISKKSHATTRFFYRYKRLKKKRIDAFLQDKLRENNFLCTINDIPCIGGTNMSLNRSKLAAIIKKAGVDPL